MTVPADFPLDDAVTARAVMRPWWQALANDDDVAALGLNHPGSLPDAGPGLAARIRDGLGVTVEQCASMGVVNTVSILRDGAWAFFCKTGARTTYERAALGRRQAGVESVIGTAARGWLIRVDRAKDGSWRVWGSAPNDETIDKVILPPLTLGISRS